MGETVTRRAAICLACACAVAFPLAAQSQARSPAGDKAGKAGAQGLAGTVVQFEEMPSRAIVYHEQQGGIVLNNVPPNVPAANPVNPRVASVPAAPATPGKAQSASTPAKVQVTSTPAKAQVASTPAKAQAGSTSGSVPLRTAQGKAAPAEGAAIRP